MIIEEKLKEIILSRYGAVKTFAEACGLPYGTVDTILRRGVHKASITNIIAICKTLNISTDELAHNRIVPIDKVIELKTDISEVSEMIAYARNNKRAFCHLTVDGIPMSSNELDILFDGIELTVEIIIRNRNRKKEKKGTE